MLSYLDEKTCAIIDELLNNTQPLTISELAQRTGVSRRMVYYHLEKVNDTLKQAKKQPIVNQQRLGIQLDTEQKNFLSTVLQTGNISYILSTEERQLLLMLYIAITPDRITLDMLMNLSETSRNTTLNDVTTIREYLEESVHNIKLDVNKKHGYHFKGKGIAAIEFMYALLTQIFQSTNDVFTTLVKNMLVEKDDSHILLSQEFKDELYLTIQSSEKDLGKKFIEKDLRHLVELFPYLILALQNIPNHQVEIDLEEVFMRLEYRIAMKVLMSLSQKYNVVFSVSDVYVATLMLLSSRKYYDNHLNSGDYKELSNSILIFIKEFELHSGVTFENKEELRQRLLMHFKVLIYRKKYNVFTKNPLKQTIKTKYKDLFTLVKMCAYSIENRMHINLNEDDIAYLTIHFGGALQQEHKKVMVHRIVILTDEGAGIQKLLAEQCKKYISRLEIVSIISRVEELPTEGTIDFIVTTMKYLAVDVPYIVVNQVFQAQDIINLLKISAGVSIEQSNEMMTIKLNQILAKYIPNATLRKEANQSIQQLLNDQLTLGRTLSEENLLLLSYLTDDKVFVKNKVDTIAESLQLLSLPLIQHQTITPDYVENILRDIQQRGTYMSIYPEVLLLHSRYISGQTKADISVLYTKEPLILAEQPYQFIILLATEENMGHMPLVMSIDYLLQTTFMQELKDTPTKENLLLLLEKKMKKDI